MTYDPQFEPLPRLPEDERAYFLKRAEDHGVLATQTIKSDSRMVHLRLKSLYEQRAAAIDVIQQD